jgi:hypothetical protein
MVAALTMIALFLLLIAFDISTIAQALKDIRDILKREDLRKN